MNELDKNLVNILRSMRVFGGHFEEQLGQLLGAADENNRQKIYQTWPEIFEKHLELAEKIAENQQGTRIVFNQCEMCKKVEFLTERGLADGWLLHLEEYAICPDCQPTLANLIKEFWGE